MQDDPNIGPAVNEPITGSTQEVFGEAPEPIPTPKPTPEPEPQPEPEPEPEPAGLSAEDIRESVRAGVRDAATPTAQPQRQYTQAELEQMFNVWKPSDELVGRILAGGEDAVKAMVEMRDGLSKQFGTLLQYSLELAKNEIADQMSPALAFASESAAARDRDEFFTEHPDLKPYERLTQTVFNSLKAEGYQADTKAEAYKTLADRTRELLPTGANGAGTAPSGGARTTTTQTGKRPAQLSSGSQAGGGGPSAPAAPFPGA